MFIATHPNERCAVWMKGIKVGFHHVAPFPLVQTAPKGLCKRGYKYLTPNGVGFTKALNTEVCRAWIEE